MKLCTNYMEILDPISPAAAVFITQELVVIPTILYNISVAEADTDEAVLQS